MRKPLIIVLSGCAFFALYSCNGGKKDNPQKDSTSAGTIAKGPIPADDEMTRTNTISFGGHEYKITVRRYPDKEQPTVKDQLDQEFFDNSVEVTITKDGEAFISETFHKKDFEENIPAEDRTGYILLGMAFDAEKTNNDHFFLAAQLGQPGGEGPSSFSVDFPVSGNGTYRITTNTQADMNIPGEAED